MLGATEDPGLPPLFTRSVAGYETVTSVLGLDADVVECGNRPPGEDQNRFYKLPVTALSCIKGRKF